MLPQLKLKSPLCLTSKSGPFQKPKTVSNMAYAHALLSLTLYILTILKETFTSHTVPVKSNLTFLSYFYHILSHFHPTAPSTQTRSAWAESTLIASAVTLNCVCCSTKGKQHSCISFTWLFYRNYVRLLFTGTVVHCHLHHN